jgi:hypothetical protein
MSSFRSSEIGMQGDLTGAHHGSGKPSMEPVHLMAESSQAIPTLEEFRATCREALGYLRGFGFLEISPPPHRNRTPYQAWFKLGDQIVVVEGEGWGQFASITLEHTRGLELPEIYLTPNERRPRPTKHKKDLNRQLQQVRDAAARLREHGTDFLEGNLTRFLKQAKPLPPYKRPDVNGSPAGGR